MKYNAACFCMLLLLTGGGGGRRGCEMSQFVRAFAIGAFCTDFQWICEGRGPKRVQSRRYHYSSAFSKKYKIYPSAKTSGGKKSEPKQNRVLLVDPSPPPQDRVCSPCTLPHALRSLASTRIQLPIPPASLKQQLSRSPFM